MGEFQCRHVVKIGGHAKHFQDSNGNIKDHNPMLLDQHYQHGFSSITEVPSQLKYMRVQIQICKTTQEMLFTS